MEGLIRNAFCDTEVRIVASYAQSRLKGGSSPISAA